MFIEKIKHLYSRVEIKTLKEGKTMFGYQTLKVCYLKLTIILPCDTDPKTSYPFLLSCPFCAKVRFLHRIAYHFFELSSTIHLFFMCDPQAFLPHLSLFYALVEFPSTQFSFPLLSPLYAKVRFPLTQFSFPIPSPPYA
jgi:hypothetical protein